MRDVKSPVGSLREERASVTRRRILEAARALFAARGYGATTLLAVALEAGVAVQTVYAVFGSKANILRSLRASVVNDPAADEAFEAALVEPQPSQALALFAHSVRLRWVAGHDVVAIHADAAAVDLAIRDEIDRVLAVRRRGIGALVLSLGQHGLASHDSARATAIIDALTLPELYTELVGIHAWSPDDYEAWLARALQWSVGELLDDPA